ncbi:hypothetical protein NMY22_g1788 [Coprinellus aureogranulatus]|nr:hypothetical protein NMY22_g1788 [Coprinellus aureogranulatus]
MPPKRKTRRDPGYYQPPDYDISQYTVESLIAWAENEEISYVSGVANNYPAGILVFARFNASDRRKYCIDGRKRLLAMKRFMDGEVRNFPFIIFFKINRGANTFLADEAEKSDTSGLPYGHENQKSNFGTKVVTVYEYQELEETHMKEIRKVLISLSAFISVDHPIAAADPWNMVETNSFQVESPTRLPL